MSILTKIYASIFIFASLISFSLNAQINEPVLFTATYNFIHVNDTNNRTSPIRIEMFLRLGKTNSVYSNASLETKIKEEQRKAGQASYGPIRSVQGGPIAVVSSAEMISDYFFQIPSKKQIIRYANLGIQDYKMEIDLPDFKWQIETETIIIGNYVCQKAVGNYAGRQWIAWFASDLPFQFGPWKLGGLPGLIFEARDTKNEVQFIFKELFKNLEQEKIEPIPGKPVVISESSFEKSKRNFEKDPSGTVQAFLPPGSEPAPTFYTDASGKMLTGNEAKAAIKKNANKKTNNPIELDNK
jgi:GLPGLI family protein